MIVHGADLKPYNTLGVSAQADYFVEVKSLDDLSRVLAWRKQQTLDADVEMPILVLGGGSNLVLKGDFHGLVIKNGMLEKEVVKETEEFVWLRVGAGENWHELVCYCMGFHYWGLENLALIPGSVGAAPIQNIGAYGVELCDVMAELTAVDIKSGVSVTFDKEACRFGYRDSIFKQRFKDSYIITSVTFKLPVEQEPKVTYPALKKHFEVSGVERPSHHQVFDAVCEVRASKLPNPEDIPNVGSFFKNPVIPEDQYQALKDEYPALVGYPETSGAFKLAAGWLIDQAGWRGKSLPGNSSGVAVHDRQALVLINPCHGTGQDVLALASSIQADVLSRYRVTLEIEPQVYGS